MCSSDLQDARVVGDRIYILLLIADNDGEQLMQRLSTEEPAASVSPSETAPSGPTPTGPADEADARE